MLRADNPLLPVVEYMQALESRTQQQANHITKLDEKIAELEKNQGAEKKDRRIQRMIDAALFCMSEKIPYIYGGKMVHKSNPEKRGSYDCSAFVQALYKSVGTTLPRTTRDQIKVGRRVKKENLMPGDLIFYDTNRNGTVNHVAMYIGNNEMIHTNSPTDGIHIQNVHTGKHSVWEIDYRRILPESALEGYGN